MQSPLLLSCKLTNAALKFLERRGEDLEPLYERFDWPLYYLRDSSSWLEADRLEYVLGVLDEVYGQRVSTESGLDFFTTVGHASPGLRAWGALDSVLKIVPGVRELYHQPDRFLASFISPQPQIQGLQHNDESAVFRIGFSDDRLPHTGRFLRAILESLPEFIGKPRAHVLWNHGNVAIEWSERQVPFAVHSSLTEHQAPSLSPELLRTILVDLSTAQRELETTRRVLQEKEVQLQQLQQKQQAAVPMVPSTGVEKALHEIYKLGDYFARAQQIVTLLRASEPLLKRTAWERVSTEAPLAIRRAGMYLRGEEIPPEMQPIYPVGTRDDQIANSKANLKTNLKVKQTPSFFDTVSN